MKAIKHNFSIINLFYAFVGLLLLIGLPIIIRLTTGLTPFNVGLDKQIILLAFDHKELQVLASSLIGLLTLCIWCVLVVDFIIYLFRETHHIIFHKSVNHNNRSSKYVFALPVIELSKVVIITAFTILGLARVDKSTSFENFTSKRVSYVSQLVAGQSLYSNVGCLSSNQALNALSDKADQTHTTGVANSLTDASCNDYITNRTHFETSYRGGYHPIAQKKKVTNNALRDTIAIAIHLPAEGSAAIGLAAVIKQDWLFRSSLFNEVRSGRINRIVLNSDKTEKTPSHMILIEANKQLDAAITFLKDKGIVGTILACVTTGDSVEVYISTQARDLLSDAAETSWQSFEEYNSLRSEVSHLNVVIPIKELQFELLSDNQSQCGALEKELFFHIPFAFSGELWLNLASLQILCIDSSPDEFSELVLRLVRAGSSRFSNIEIVSKSKVDLHDIGDNVKVSYRQIEGLEEIYDEICLHKESYQTVRQKTIDKLRVIIIENKLEKLDAKLLGLYYKKGIGVTQSLPTLIVLRSSQDGIGWMVTPFNRFKSTEDLELSSGNHTDMLTPESCYSIRDTNVEISETPEITVKLLGPVEIVGAVHKVWRPRMLESIVYFALHPDGVSKATWVSAIWPDQHVSRDSLNTMLWQLRKALGCDKYGNRHFPSGSETNSKRLKLAQSVTTDVVQFRRLSQSPNIDDWKEALKLVRGRPFDGIIDSGWVVFEGHLAEVESLVTKCAIELSEQSFENDDPETALWSARQGLLAVPYDERLWRIVLRATYAISKSIPSLESVMNELLSVLGYKDSPEKISIQTLNLYNALCRALSTKDNIAEATTC